MGIIMKDARYFYRGIAKGVFWCQCPERKADNCPDYRFRPYRSGKYIKILFCLLLLLPLLNTGCTTSGVESCAENPEGAILVEVIRQSATNYPPGRILVARLYENRVLEYESFPLTPAPGFKTELRRHCIDSETLGKVRSLILELDAEKPTTYYAPRLKMSLDSQIQITLKYDAGSGQKEIVMKENDSSINFNALGSVPLKELLKLIYAVRSAVDERV